MMRGVLYVRVSSREQQEEGYSVEAQVEHGLEYARRQGIEIVKTWAVAESAMTDDRKAFAELIDFMKASRDVHAMVFEKADRMTRNYHDFVKVYDLIERADKVAHFFKENFHVDKNSKSSEKLRLDLQVVLARNYINNLSEEVKKGMYQKLKKGGLPGMAPIGYKNNLETHDVELDQAQFRLVKHLFELCATGGYSLTDLAAMAKKEGLQYWQFNRPIGRSAVYHLLTNPFYFGMIRWGRQLVPGKHEPIISKALFDRVQETLGNQNRPRSKTFAFRGLGICGECESAITAETKRRRFKNGTQRSYVYYHCTGHKRGKVCAGSYIREEELAAQLGEPLKGLTIDATCLREIRNALRESFGSEAEFHKSRIETLQRELTKIRTRLEAAYNDRLDGLLTVDEFRDKADAWRRRQAELQIEIQAHQRADVGYLQEASRILDLAQRAYDLYMKQKDYFEKRKLVELLVSKVVISGGRAVSNLREPFQTLSRVALTANSSNRRPKWLGR